MINPHVVLAGTKDAVVPEKKASLDVIVENGIYVMVGGKPIRVQKETYDLYIGRGKWTGKIRNPHSQLEVSNPLEFVVKNDAAGPLYRLDEKNNHREVGLSPHVNIDRKGKLDVQKGNNQISFDPIIDSLGYRIRLQNLSKGEYGFMCLEPHDYDQNGKKQQYHLCTFRVID